MDLYRRESAGDLATKITLMRRRSAGGFEQDETRGHADAAADENHAEDDSGHQLRRGDGPRGRCAAARMLKTLCMSHEPTRGWPS